MQNPGLGLVWEGYGRDSRVGSSRVWVAMGRVSKQRKLYVLMS